MAGMLVITGVAICAAFFLHTVRRAADIKRVTANAQLLGQALSPHQLRTGALPASLEELVADEGHVIPSYLQALTNHFVVAYTPVSNAPDSAIILTVSDLRHTAAVTRGFHVNVAR